MGYGASTTLGAAALASVLGLAAVIAGCQNTHRAPGAPLIQAPPNCVDINFPIYFEPRSSAVTREADRLIIAARDQARDCQVTGIVVVGLADAPGSPDANLNLSRRRANAVTAELHRRGFTTVEFRETAAGAVGASTAGGASKPLRRRADVSIHLMARSTLPSR
jgi:outer membrane protein OmpA-like peptidoglycan-associated protein